MSEAKDVLTRVFGYQVRTGYEVQSGATTCAPTLVWADADYEVGDGLCGLHTNQKQANEPSIPYARFDVLMHLTAENDRLKARVAELEDALKPFAFLDSETPQEAWDLSRNDRFKDWISYEEIEQARAALKNKDASDD